MQLENHFNDIYYHINNNNSSLSFRLLCDLVIGSKSPVFYKKLIQLKQWEDKNGEDNPDFIGRIKTLTNELEQSIPKEVKADTLLLSAKEITKSYGKAFSLGPVSLDIKAGNLIGLVGENGNGKTTLLRILANDLRYNTGVILYPFQNTTVKYDQRSFLTYIPQRTPKWYGSVKDNLKLAATHHGISSEQNEEYVLLWMIRFGLWKFKDFRWDELSSGYKMRFELARTLLRQPKLLLIDEPLANLDILAQQLILEDLRLISKNPLQPIGIVLSSQQLYEVEKVADEVIFLRNGKPTGFNSLRTNNATLTIEIQSETSKELLELAIKPFDVRKIEFIGGNYIIEVNGTNTKDLLLSLVNSNVDIKYFRDITYSTRKLFTA